MLGTVLKKMRLERNMTIKDVAEQANITRSLISQIENDKASPSINTLTALSKVYNVPIGSFFETNDPEHEPIVRKDKRDILKTLNGITYYLLTPNLKDHNLEFIYNVYEPGSSTKVSFSHKGEECGIILQGRLEVVSGEKTYILEEGDSIILDSKIPHKYTNASQDTTIAIWINSPPSW